MKEDTLFLSDEEILRLFFDREESAIEAADQKYGRLLMKIAKDLVRDPEDAEQCVWDGYWKAWNAIPPEKPGSLRAFLAAIVRNLAISVLRKDVSKRRGAGAEELSYFNLEEFLPSKETPESIAETKLLSEAIDRFAMTLPARRKYVFIGRFYFEKTIRELAKELGVGTATVSEELRRIRSDLRDYLESEDLLT